MVLLLTRRNGAGISNTVRRATRTESPEPRQRLCLEGVEASGRRPRFNADVQSDDAAEHTVAAGVAGLLRLDFDDPQQPVPRFAGEATNARRLHVDRRCLVQFGDLELIDLRRRRRGCGVDRFAQVEGRETWNTNSPVARTLASVSFSRDRPVLHENRMTGGAVETMLKCEKGARLTWPSGLWLLIQPIGRGATIALKIARLSLPAVLGSTNMKSTCRRGIVAEQRFEDARFVTPATVRFAQDVIVNIRHHDRGLRW